MPISLGELATRFSCELIGDADVIRDDIAKYGSVTEMSITEPRFQP